MIGSSFATGSGWVAVVGVVAADSSTAAIASGFASSLTGDATLATGTGLGMMIPGGGLTLGPNDKASAFFGSGGLTRLPDDRAGGGANVGGVGGGWWWLGVKLIDARSVSGLASGVGISGGAGPSEAERSEGVV